MPVYLYKAKTFDGQTVKGTIEGNDRTVVISMLKERKYYPVRIIEQGMLQKDITFEFMESVKLKELAVFCRQFSTIINAGVSVLGCLDMLRQQTENKKLKKIIDKIYESVQKGYTLSGAMQEHKSFPPILLNMIEAGEISGSLDVALERMAAHFEKESKLKQKVQEAMTYPIIISMIAFIVITILLAFVVPTFVNMFAGLGMELPSATKALLGISSFIRTRWYIALGVSIVLTALFKYFTATDFGRNVLDMTKLKMPIFGPLNRKIVSSRFTRTLGTLLASGLPILTCLEVSSRVVGNYAVYKGLDKVRQDVSRGESLSKPIGEMGIFPPMVTHMMKIGEDTGALESILAKTADFYDDEVETVVTQMTTLLEPLILCVMAVVIGFIVLSIVQPMFGMYGGITG